MDLEKLSCDHHLLMLAGLALIPQNPLNDPGNVQLKVCEQWLAIFASDISQRVEE